MLQTDINKAQKRIPGGVGGIDKLKTQIQDMYQQRRVYEEDLEEISIK